MGVRIARIGRRDFLRQVGQASLALGIGAQLGALSGCGDRDVEQPSGAYDAIIVGGGTVAPRGEYTICRS